MSNQNIFEELLLQAEKTNLQVLMDNALNEKYPDKKKESNLVKGSTIS